MRRLTLIGAVLLAGSPALAIGRPASPPPPTPASAPQPSADELVAELRQRLLVSQQQIAKLEQQLADEKTRSFALATCRARNGRLVEAGKLLIAGYEKRYKKAHRDPLQPGRRRFESELQDIGETIYDNRADIPFSIPAPTASDTAPQTKGN